MSAANHQCVHVEVWPLGYDLDMRKELLLKKKLVPLLKVPR